MPQSVATRFVPLESPPDMNHTTSPASGRSILNRLKSPFSSKQRNVTDFHVSADEPHRHFSPGDHVKGQVTLSVHRPLRITHLTVSLHGFVCVKKNDGVGRGDFENCGRGKKSYDVANGFWRIFEDEIVLYGDEMLKPSHYKIGFELEFPEGRLPTSLSVSSNPVAFKTACFVHVVHV
jgi:arrestin-related trafficking adapter 9